MAPINHEKRDPEGESGRRLMVRVDVDLVGLKHSSGRGISEDHSQPPASVISVTLVKNEALPKPLYAVSDAEVRFEYKNASINVPFGVS